MTQDPHPREWNLCRGEVISADFEPEGDEDRIILHVALPKDSVVGHARVVVIDEAAFIRLMGDAVR